MLDLGRLFRQPRMINRAFIPSCRFPLIDWSQTLEMLELHPKTRRVAIARESEKTTDLSFFYHTLHGLSMNSRALSIELIRSWSDANLAVSRFQGDSTGIFVRTSFHEWAVNYPSEDLPSFGPSRSSSERFSVFIDQFLKGWVYPLEVARCRNMNSV